MFYSSWGDMIYASSLMHPNKYYSKMLTVDKRQQGIDYINFFITEAKKELMKKKMILA